MYHKSSAKTAAPAIVESSRMGARRLVFFIISLHGRKRCDYPKYCGKSDCKSEVSIVCVRHGEVMRQSGNALRSL